LAWVTSPWGNGPQNSPAVKHSGLNWPPSYSALPTTTPCISLMNPPLDYTRQMLLGSMGNCIGWLITATPLSSSNMTSPSSQAPIMSSIWARVPDVPEAKSSLPPLRHNLPSYLHRLPDSILHLRLPSLNQIRIITL